MITAFSKATIEAYLNRELNDYSWIKEGVAPDLLESIKVVCPTFNPKLSLFTHQLAGIYLGLCLDQFLFFLDMGLGKTILALSLIQCRIDLKQVNTALVVVPNVVNIENWLYEIASFTNLTAVGLSGNKNQRLAALNQPAQIKLINYDGLKVLMAELKEVKSRKKAENGQKRRRQIDNFAARDFANSFDMLVLDECHHVKNTTSLNFKLCNILADHIHYRIGMTGTPIGRHATGFWGQFYIIDRGETLGIHETLFHQALFRERSTRAGYIERYLPKKNEVKLHLLLQNRSIRYSDEECNDVPSVTFIKVNFTLTDEVKRYGKQLIKTVIQTVSDDTEQKKKENIYAKTRQLCSGFIYEGTEENRVTIRFPHNQKLVEVEDIVTELPPDSKIVIFHYFQESGRQIIELLKKLKLKFVIIGGLSEDNVEAYRQFRNNPDITILVLNMASGGEGLNLQIANYAIVYEPIDHPDTDRQAIKRILRTGQTKHCFVYRFITASSVEERIMEFVTEGKHLFDALLEGKVEINSLIG